MNCRIAFNKLERELGLLDSYIELSELSHRDFILNAENASSVEEFVKNKSRQHNIIVSTNSISKIKNTFIPTYISLTYNAFEIFFDDFRNEYNLFSKNKFDYRLTKKGGKSTTRLNFLLEKFEKLEQRIPRNHIILFNYFRTIRIRTTHQKFEIKNIENAYQKITLDKKVLEKRPKKEFRINSIPNDYENLTFDDWLMFTKLVKSIAYEISKLTEPEPLSLITYYNLKRFNKYSDIQRKKESVKKILWSDFVIDEHFSIFGRLNEIM